MLLNENTPLDQADAETLLAVDLIYLLETNEVDIDVALSAIKIVEKDLLRRKNDLAKTL